MSIKVNLELHVYQMSFLNYLLECLFVCLFVYLFVSSVRSPVLPTNGNRWLYVKPPCESLPF